MKQIIGAFGTLFMLAVLIVSFVSVITVTGNVAAAKEYKADVVAQIENSDFNSSVINSCISQAQAEGYGLEITNCQYDDLHNIQTAEVVLSYRYRLPVFGIEQTKTVRGIAR